MRDVVSANGDACAVGVVSLLWLDLANDLGVGDFSAAVGWDLVIGNGEEGVGAFDTFASIGYWCQCFDKGAPVCLHRRCSR